MINSNRSPKYVLHSLDLLSEDLDLHVPPKKADRNILIATWNVQAFGEFTPKRIASKKDSPKRDLLSLASFVLISSRFDIVAVQEVTADISALKKVMSYLRAS